MRHLETQRKASYLYMDEMYPDKTTVEVEAERRAREDCSQACMENQLQSGSGFWKHSGDEGGCPSSDDTQMWESNRNLS